MTSKPTKLVLSEAIELLLNTSSRLDSIAHLADTEATSDLVALLARDASDLILAGDTLEALHDVQKRADELEPKKAPKPEPLEVPAAVSAAEWAAIGERLATVRVDRFREIYAMVLRVVEGIEAAWHPPDAHAAIRALEATKVAGGVL